MKIVFIHQGGASMASYRFRSEIPAKALESLGHETHVNSGEGDIVVFSKPMLTDFQIAEDVKSQGAKVVLDIGDDHLTHPLIGPLYMQMIKIADKIVCPTQNMAERVYRISARSPDVIPDPYEEELQEAHADDENLLWFGHMSNLKDLTPWKPMLNGIRICTGPRPQENQKPHKTVMQTGPSWNDSWIEWSPENQTAELKAANIVLLPTRRGAENKSANRLLNAVRGGCFVVASHHPSHEEFKKMLWVGDIKSGLDWTRAFRSELNDRVKEAQEYVEKNYSPQVIGSKWDEFLRGVA